MVVVAAMGGCSGRTAPAEPPPAPSAPPTHTAPGPAAPAATAGALAGAATAPPAAPAATDALDGCTRLPFADHLPIAEASGAVWLPDDGGVLVVVADSGHDGAYLVIDAGDGRVREQGKLPLGPGGGDDLEGLTSDGERLWAITSSGWLRAWRPRAGGGFALDVGPYRIDDEDGCALTAVNCGSNYEGLCLARTAAARAALGGCGGYAAAKTTGRLVCLVQDDGRWRVEPGRAIEVTGPEMLAGCDIDDAGAVWTGDNLFGAMRVRKLVGGEVVASARLGVGFPEALAVSRDGTIYRFSDTGGAPSGVAAYRCAGAGSADGKKGAGGASGG